MYLDCDAAQFLNIFIEIIDHSNRDSHIAMPHLMFATLLQPQPHYQDKTLRNSEVSEHIPWNQLNRP